MELFKTELGWKESLGELPRFHPANSDDYEVARSVLKRIFKDLNLSERAIYEAMQTLPVLPKSVEGNAHELSSALAEAGLAAPENLYIFFPSGRGLDDIDVVRFEDLDVHLDYYWYPSRDDMVVLSIEPAWCLYLSHFGSLQCAT